MQQDDPTPNATPSVALAEAPPAHELTRRERFRRIGPAGVMAVLSLVLPPVGAIALANFRAPVAAAVTGHVWGPVVCVLAISLLGGFALVPTGVMAIFCGWAFKFPVGFPMAVLGFTGASLVGYLVARRASGHRLLDVIEEHPRWRIVHEALLGGRSLRVFWIIFLLRTPSVPPFAMTTVSLAALNVRLAPFLLGTLVGVMPRTAAYVLAASTMQEAKDDVGDNWVLITSTIVGTVAAMAVITVVARRALAKMTAGEIKAEAVRPE